MCMSIGPKFSASAAAAGLKLGVCMISRYCSFCRAARLANSSTHSPTSFGIFYGLKVIEGCEKVIVPRVPGGGNKGSHGEYVDQLVVELLVGESVGCPLAFFAANRLRGQTARHGRRLVENEGPGVDAEIVFRSLGDEAFGVHGARQVGVQIGALGHVVQEGVKGERSLLAGVLEGSSGAGFAILGDGLRLRDGGRREADQQRGGDERAQPMA